MLNAAKMFHQNLKNNIKNVKFISPLLKCFKTITKSGTFILFFNYLILHIILKLIIYLHWTLETIVGVLLRDSFLLTLEKLIRENNKYLIKNKQYVILVILANITKKGINIDFECVF